MTAARPDGTTGPEALTLDDVAGALGVHYMTAYRYVRTGLLAAHRSGGRWWVSPGALEEFRSGRATDPGPVAPHRSRPPRQTTRPAKALANRLLAGDEPGSWRIIDDRMASGWEFEEVCVDLLGRALRNVGDRWESGQVTVADEHRASVVAARLIGRMGPRVARRGRTRGTVVLAAAPGDRHGLPCALMADLLRLRGLSVADLGADTPAEEVAVAAAGEDRLLAVGICATTEVGSRGLRDLRDAVDQVRSLTGAPVLLGGRAAGDPGVFDRSGADHLSTDTASALAWFDSVAPRGSAAPGASR